MGTLQLYSSVDKRWSTLEEQLLPRHQVVQIFSNVVQKRLTNRLMIVHTSFDKRRVHRGYATLVGKTHDEEHVRQKC